MLLKDPLSALKKNILGCFIIDPINLNYNYILSKNISALADILKLDSNS
jgi:hypothetical protein